MDRNRNLTVLETFGLARFEKGRKMNIFARTVVGGREIGGVPSCNSAQGGLTRFSAN